MVFLFFVLLPSVYMGWSLGANDAANIFGTGVMTGVIRFRTACLLISLFVILGALLEGQKTIHTVGYFTQLNLKLALIATLAGASVVTLMTVLSLPVSTSQAILGGVMGISIFVGGVASFPWDKFTRIVLSWILTPFGAMVISFGLYWFMSFLSRKVTTLPGFTLLMTLGIIGVGSYGAYSLGANNVANTTGVFVGAGELSPFLGTLIGGASIALGASTYSRRVMETIGNKIVPLDPIAAFIVILAEAIALHIFTQVGVPVSASQAVVGAVAGVGLVKGVRTVNRKTLAYIFMGWISTPLLAILFSFFLLRLFS